jgi:pimeloyl-ACP methyl ester carboxylesterase
LIDGQPDLGNTRTKSVVDMPGHPRLDLGVLSWLKPPTFDAPRQTSYVAVVSTRSHIRGLKALVHDAVDATVELVWQGHESASRSIDSAGSAVGLGAPVRGVENLRMGATRGVLNTISGVNRAVEVITDAAIDKLAPPAQPNTERRALPLRDDVAGDGPWWNDALVGALNGAVGDHLARRRNPLGAPMCLRIDDLYHSAATAPCAFDELRDIVVFVHGLAATEWSWVLGAEQSWGEAGTHFGTLLERDFGLNPVYARYNTGRPIADNGADLARLLDLVTRRAPNLRSIVIIGHSMGGLVTREACRVGNRRKHRWTDLVTHVVYLGSPHTGAPLARLARGASGVLGGVDLPATRVISRIIEGRSDGIKDLADGLETDLLPHAHHTFVSGTVTHAPEHPLGWILGDLLVRRSSAEGDKLQTERHAVSREHRGRVLHHELQNHPAVYEVLTEVLSR